MLFIVLFDFEMNILKLVVSFGFEINMRKNYSYYKV